MGKSKSGKRGAIGDALISCGAIVLLVGILLAMDGRVREQVSLRFAARPATQVTQASGQLHDLASIVYNVVRDQASEHTTLTIFIVAATVLTVFMVRT
jgi:hypothetical protein